MIGGNAGIAGKLPVTEGESSWLLFSSSIRSKFYSELPSRFSATKFKFLLAEAEVSSGSLDCYTIWVCGLSDVKAYVLELRCDRYDYWAYEFELLFWMIFKSLRSPPEPNCDVSLRLLPITLWSWMFPFSFGISPPKGWFYACAAEPSVVMASSYWTFDASCMLLWLCRIKEGSPPCESCCLSAPSSKSSDWSSLWISGIWLTICSSGLNDGYRTTYGAWVCSPSPWSSST